MKDSLNNLPLTLVKVMVHWHTNENPTLNHDRSFFVQNENRFFISGK
jgi:hypothetical protein